jgi:hypothetical protein
MPLDYLTFWGRKATAERVGDGDLKEFFVKLQKLYIDRNNDPSADPPTFMGLVTIGHSFGGQVLFKAVSGAFEKDLINEVASAKDKGQSKLPGIVSGLGDMAVLMNPALEAFQYERIDRLTRQVAFNELQTPVLFTVSSENDSARQFWFPVGRYANFLFRPWFKNKVEKDLWMTALGEYEPQQTHTLEKHKDMPTTMDDKIYRDCALKHMDFTAPLVLGEAQFSPKSNRCLPYSPAIIAYTDNELVDDHSGIFGPTFRDFLSVYVALAEGKRIFLIKEEQAKERSRRLSSPVPVPCDGR